MQPNTRQFSKKILLAALLMSSGLCVADNTKPVQLDRASGFNMVKSWANRSREDSPVQITAKECINLLAQNDLQRASKKCNQALSLNIQDTRLQLLNGLVYHLQFLDGDSEKAALAEQGYNLALQFDPTNWSAHYFMGLLALDQRKYGAAKDAFSAALLFEPDDPEVLLGLATSSYYNADPATSVAAIKRLEKASQDQHFELRPSVVHLAAIAFAAVGDQEQADKWLKKAKEKCLSGNQCQKLEKRLDQWSAVYKYPARSDNEAPVNPDSSKGAIERTQFAQPGGFPGQPGGFPGQPGFGGQPGFPGQPGFGPQQSKSSRMIMLDVVLIKMQDTLSTRMGINLLNSLTFQFGSSSAPAFSRSVATTEGSSGTSTTTLTRAITVPALTYSLNIANAATQLDEVLARPTIVAIDGLKSEFFSGDEINAAAVSGNSGGVGGQAIQVQKEIGVRLGLTPTFKTNDKIGLDIRVERTFLTPSSSDVNYSFIIQTQKLNMNSNVELEFGQTLVLGGLSEKETTRTRTGVPILQDIPGLQYLFSQLNTSSFQRSVLILITPRDPYFTYRDDDEVQDLKNPSTMQNPAEPQNSAVMNAPPGMPLQPSVQADTNKGPQRNFKQLQQRYGDWFEPYPALASVFNHLGKTSLYREFRTGDVTLERWDRQESTYQRLKQSLDFLFY